MSEIPFLASLATAAPGYGAIEATDPVAIFDRPPSPRRGFLLGLLTVLCLLLVPASSR